MPNSRWILAAAAFLTLVACYKTPKPNCTFSCGPSDECPSDYTCAPDRICHLSQGNGFAACDQSFNDAAPADAPPIDARRFDAAVIDAKPVDARPIDAKPVDAKPIDAKPVDAKPIDAKPIDASFDASFDAAIDAT